MLPQTLLNIVKKIFCSLPSFLSLWQNRRLLSGHAGWTDYSFCLEQPCTFVTDFVGVLVGVTVVEEAPLPSGSAGGERIGATPVDPARISVAASSAISEGGNDTGGDVGENSGGHASAI